MTDIITPQDDSQNSGQKQAGTQGNQNQTSCQNDDYAALKAELEQTQIKLQEMVTISQRALADLQNFRRRSEEEKTNFVQYANAELIIDLLPAIDNIHRALNHDPKDTNWAEGVKQSLKQLTQVLEKRNVKNILTTGQKFDPTLHEALLVGPGEKDMVIEELEKGYMLGDKVIKRARVKVGNGEASGPKEIPSES